ncbi:hypothetical protein CEUSTIGMA_g4670.t1 [Chlamydomonas eustigma]|uniref:CUB domain-containing protein n=1 Tax=Chlamydomonas eustigma TaxID=1157962 RepID=A0A250X2A0_9CHLO|nr:hypothetical protein CEUSTIGMA_g4670.t1 [Chlamydomonas eustigma]|eukprot:GAX77224.1 hypothetical protein CEUSTIGMA_g4670.t1 [Chlamydomonas eustigma]
MFSNMNRNRLCLTITSTFVVSLASQAWGGFTPSHGWDVYYDWTVPYSNVPSSSPWNLSCSLEVTLDPGASSSYYWSLYTFFSANVPVSGVSLPNDAGAYMGLQTNGNHKSIIFSVWNGVEGTPNTSPAGKALNHATGTMTSYCDSFGGEGTGYHCFYIYN